MDTFRGANVGLVLIGVSLGAPVFAHSDEIVCGTTYVVESGDSLSNISEWAYGTANRVDEIYAANTEKIGPDPTVLLIGTELEIPCIDGEEILAGESDSASAAAAQAEAEAAAALVAAAQASAANAQAEKALAEAEAAAEKAAAALAAAKAEAKAKAAEVEATAQAAAKAAAVEEAETQAPAVSDADSAEDLMAMSGELLTIEGFDAGKVIALIDTLDLADGEKTTLRNAVVAAEGKPILLRAVLTNISNQIDR